MIRNVKGCSFCEEVKAGVVFDPILSALGLPPLRRIIAVNSNHFLVPSVGPLVRGHVLLVTKKHFSSVRSMPQTPRLALEGDLTRVHAKMEKYFASPIFVFEHGLASSDDRRGTCIEHTHIHLLPLPDSVIDGVSKDVQSGLTLQLGEVNTEVFGAHCDYAIYGRVVKELRGFGCGSIESQLFRKLIAKHLGCPNTWNWRDYPNIADVTKHAEELRLVQGWLS